MYDKLFVPTDGSRASDLALDHALSLAKIHDAAVHVVYVVDTTVYYRHPGVADTVIAELEADGERLMQDLRDRFDDEPVSIQTEIGYGIPHEEIQEYASENNVDLIVMGTHGKTPLKRAVMGSVTEWLVTNCDRPVLTVKDVEKEGTLESERKETTE
ncbi:MAG: universal stress protein [Halobacteria archaeon]